MKTHRAVTAVAFAAAILVIATLPARAALELGQKVPAGDVAMKNVDGEQVTIDGVAGKTGTLVIFTCNHCPYAKAWESRIAEIGNAYSAKGIGVIAINANDPEAYPEDGFDTMVERARKLSMEFPYVVDATSGVARAFGASRTPEAFLFDASGKLVYHGTIDDNYKDASAVEKTYLRDALDAVLAGTAVPMPETKALGCGIKFRS